MKSQNYKAMVIFAILIFVVFGLSPIWQNSQARVAGPLLRIGVLAPKTGFGASWAVEGLAGLEVAKEEIHSLGGVDGVPVEFIVYDTATKPQEAIQMMNKLIYTDRVLTIIGPTTTSECEVSFPIANRARISCVGLLSATPGVSARFRPWAFRNTLTSDKILGPLVKYWARDNKTKKAAIIYDKKFDYTKFDGEKFFPAALQAAGIEILGSVTYLTGDIDFSAQVTKIKTWNVDSLILSCLHPEAALIVKEVKKQNLRVSMVGGLDLMSPQFIRLGGSAAEGVWTAHSFWPENPDPKFQRVMKKARLILKDKEPSANTARYYDNAMINYHLIKELGVTNRSEDLESDREKIMKGWTALKDFPGVEGKITMNEDGDGQKTTYIFVVENGKFKKMY
jgi:branched-chain amino acid transport system substrate-binding protein